MKKLIYVVSLVLVVTLFFSSNLTFTNALVNIDKNNNYELYEQKIYCQPSIDDDFATDSVIVTLKNKISLKFNEYDIDDFSDVSAVSVVNIAPYTYGAIKDKYEAILASDIVIKENKSLTEIVNNTFSKSDSINSSLNKYLNSENFIPLLNKKLNGQPLFSDKIKKSEFEFLIKNYICELEDKHKFLKKYDYSKYHLTLKLTLPTNSKQEVIDAIEKLELRDDILCASPNYYAKFDSVPNDEYISEQWYLDKIDYFDAIDYVGNTETVTVGILDSGINALNPDLKGKVDVNLSKSFVDNEPLIDTTGHGTSVAGIIGAKNNNEIGVTGICENVNLVSLKVGIQNAEHSAVQMALDYAEANNIDLINCSFQLIGYSESYYQQMKAVFDVYSGLIICAAGNNNKNMDETGNFYYFPLALDYENIIAVAATDENNELAIFDDTNTNSASCFGAITVDLAAPGKNIYTTSSNLNENYRYFSGTSAAAPIVTGVVALIKSLHPEITNAQLRTFILNNVDIVDSLSEKVATSGIINVNKILSDINKKKFTVQYNANGGSGDAMNNSTVYYGVNQSLSAVTYTKLDYRFVGWTAHRTSDNKWLYTDNNGNNRWCLENCQPNGYVKFIYKNCAKIAKTSSVNNDIVTLYAQWEELSLGDINMDGRVSIADASLLQKYLSETVELTVQQKRLADVNMDGIINVFDVTEIQRLIASI